MSRQLSCNLSALALAILCLAAGGCQSVTSDQRGGFVLPPDLGLNSLMALPRPFHTDPKDLPLTMTSMGRSDIALPAIAELSAANNQIIKRALTDAADAADILLLPDLPDRPVYVLEGIAHRTDTSLAISWYLHDAKNRLVKKFEISAQLSNTPGGMIGEAAAKDLSTQTMAALSLALGATGGVMSQPVQAPSSASAPAKIYVGTVNGAPGDGDRALPAALRSMLREDGASLVGNAAQADFILSSKVVTEKLPQDRQRITLTWQLMDRTGTVAGAITQANEVKAGSLDGDWGQTAFDIASAAEDGLGDMLSEIEARKTGLAEDRPNGGPVIPDILLERHGPKRAPPAVGKPGGE